MYKPELLAPAGDMEKLKYAIHYGADAVYLAYQSYGLRAKSKNFDFQQLDEGVRYAHSKGVKVYVTVNIYAHNEDFVGLEEFFKTIESLNVDAVIISDLGVFSVAKETLKKTDIHISTQANNTNYKAVMFWQKLGAKRVVLARELSLEEVGYISREVNKEEVKEGVELEAFVHGAMCISYSGRCLLSNYLSGRDSNKGGCSQPCRWGYNLVEEGRPGEYMPIQEDERGTYIFNSKDLCMIQHIPDLIKAGVCSFKIEGRMKSPYYVATTVKAYREAIDDFCKDPTLYESRKDYYLAEVQKNSHRKFTTGFYYGKTDGFSQVYENSTYIRTHDFVGVVLGYDEETGLALVEQRNKIVKGDEIEIFSPRDDGFSSRDEGFSLSQDEGSFIIVDEMYDEYGNVIEEAPHAQQIIKIRMNRHVSKMDILRMEIK